MTYEKPSQQALNHEHRPAVSTFDRFRSFHEMMLLSRIICWFPDLLPEVNEILEPKHFVGTTGSTKHSLIFQAMAGLQEPFDITTIGAEMTAMRVADPINVNYSLADLIDFLYPLFGSQPSDMDHERRYTIVLAHRIAG